MAVSPGLVSWMHSKLTVQTAGGAFLQIDDGLAALRQDIERGAADADGRERRRDLVGGLVRMAGDEAKRARGQPHRDVAIMMLVVEHGAVELERRIGSEREIGAVGHHQPRGAVEAGAHDFVADQSVADIDLAGRRSGNAEHFILDDGGFADAGLRVELDPPSAPQQVQLQIEKENSYAKFISKPIDLSRHRTGSRTHAMWQNYHKRRLTSPCVSDGEFEMRSMRWT